MNDKVDGIILTAEQVRQFNMLLADLEEVEDSGTSEPELQGYDLGVNGTREEISNRLKDIFNIIDD